MEDEADRLLSIAGCVADGSATDWEAMAAEATPSELEIIRQLRMVAKLAGLHRSLAARDEADSETDTSETDTRELPAGPHLGEWAHLILLERLGSGTSGEVYRARDRQLDRDVALKLLKNPSATLDDTEIIKEGRLLALIDHPNVVTVYGVAVDRQRVGLWMRLVRGSTLAARLAKEGPLSAEEASLIGIDVCSALAEIHKKGLVHRDIKAQNVMREDGGRIVLMDLGTGRHANRSSTRGDMVGTPLYLAPEIFAGSPAGTRSDIYSVGVLLYHLVTKAFPVMADSVEELMQQLATGVSTSLRDARPDLPLAFVRVVERALSANPDGRPASAGAFELDLEQALHAMKAHTRAVAGAPVAVAQPVVNAIAVLPFQNLNPDRQLDYFCDGITEEIINALATIRYLRVAARDSVFQLKGTSHDVRHVGAILNVQAVLGGSVRAADDRLRIITRLSSAETGHQLWSERFDRPVAGAFAVQDEIARSVVQTLQIQLNEGSLARTPSTRNAEAYRLYLQGRHHWNKRTEEGLHRSVECFQRALDLDPAFSPALAGLADAYVMLAVYGAQPPHEVMPRARAAARRVAVADTTPGVLATLAGVSALYDWDWLEAENLFRRATSGHPDQSMPHQWYAMNFLAPHGRFAEAEAELRAARELDPLSLAVASSVGLLAYFARRYDEAIEALSRAIDLDDRFAFAHFALGLTYAELSRFDAAAQAFSKAIALSPGSPEILAGLGYSAALAGQVDRAREILGELLTAAGRRYVSASLVAQIHTALSEVDAAFVWLAKALDERATDLAWIGVRPVFDRLRGDERFKALSTRIGVAPDA